MDLTRTDTAGVDFSCSVARGQIVETSTWHKITQFSTTLLRYLSSPTIVGSEPLLYCTGSEPLLYCTLALHRGDLA